MNQSSAACGIILAEDLFRNAMQIQRSKFSKQVRMFISGLLSLSALVLLAACATPDWGPVTELSLIHISEPTRPTATSRMPSSA